MGTGAEGGAETPLGGRVEAGREAEFLRLLLENLDVGVAVLDEDLRYRLISAGVYRDLGIDPEAFGIGSTLSECHEAMAQAGLLTPEMISAGGLSEDEQRERAKAGAGAGGFETSLVTLGNGTTHRHARKTLSNGYTLSMAHDVSELVEKDELLEGALALGMSGYWTYEFATKRYTLSRGFKAFLGRELVERVHAQGIIVCVNPADRPRFKEGIEQLKRGARKFSVESRNPTHKGTERWSRTTMELVRDPNGRPLRMRAFVRDITEMRLKEAELERAKDEAIAASHAKSEFLANMSHEIRTPMNGVLGMAELLAESAVDARQREYIDVINNSANALLNIINDILDFSKIEAGALEIDPMPFDMRDCVSDVTSLLIASAQDKGLELIIDYPSELPHHFIGDAGRIRQVLTNLVGNAIKFTESGYVKIRVGAARKGERAVVTLDVTDTGIGIAPGKLSRIFDKFTQADGSTTRVYGGTGLGLTITKRIVEMMGGRVSVSSVLGSGSTFSARIPLPVDLEAREEQFDTGVLAGRRALVVDDIDVNCNVLRRQLAGWNIAADCAHNGVEAIEALRRAQAEGRPYDLVLLDYLMPGINGRELAAMLHGRTDIHMPPTVMLSSCDQPVSSADLAAIGIDSYLVKPVRERRLYDTAVRVLSNPRAAHAQATRPAQAPLPAPVADITAAVHAPAPTPAQAPSPAQTDILVAEDFALNRDVVRLMLQGTPFAPVFAENGQAALDMFKAEPDRFPVIIMDVSMPVMDGHTATREIRRWEAEQGRAPVPVIALTGHAMKKDVQDCRDAGMDDVLTKPVKQAALMERLEHFSGRAVHSARVA